MSSTMVMKQVKQHRIRFGLFPVRQLLVIVGLVFAAVSPVLAQRTGGELSSRQKQRLAYSHLSDVDADFALMGEYEGVVRDARGCCVRIGLQVVALGDGAFGGMSYRGGLPGAGWNRRARTPVQGDRSGNQVHLAADTFQVVVNGMQATIVQGGRVLGRLGKIRRSSPTMGMRPPWNAISLFDGRDTTHFKNGQLTEERLLQEGTELVKAFRDYTLHIEFRLPYMPYAREQGRSNSGVYLQSSYEVQILDSFGLEGAFNECGALYRYRKPDLNMCFPPLSWQTYDLTFHSPRFDADGNKTRNARLTVLHNGVVVHDNFEVERKTGAGRQESPQLWPTKLQDHGNPVRFRNIWLVDLDNPPAIRGSVVCAPRPSVFKFFGRRTRR